MEKQNERERFRPKKRLGQNFLIDKNVQKKIIRACGITPSDIVLEIGAGRGELTKLIAQECAKVYALEIDRHLYSVLKDNFSDSSRVEIINQSVLEFNIAKYFRGVSRIKVIGNLPYNITTPIIVHLLKFRDKIGDIFITIQKEFARRTTASCGNSDWSAFSCFLQYYTAPRILFLIKRTCFRPQPKVDSALVKLTPKEELPLDAGAQRQLFKIIRSSFQQRRKTLRNALSGVISSGRLNQYLKRYNMDKNIRGEQLSLQDFINLAKTRAGGQ